MFFNAVSLRRHRMTLFCSLRFPPRDLSAKTNRSIGRDARVRNAWNTRRSDRRKRKIPLSSFSRFLSRLSKIADCSSNLSWTAKSSQTKPGTGCRRVAYKRPGGLTSRT
jgi:hypothetical protein